VNPSHTYAAAGSYTVSLVVSDGAAMSPSSTTTATVVRPNQPPVAQTGGPYSGVAGEPVSFDASASSDPDGDPLTYQWNFGDGEAGSGMNPGHVYAAAGTFTASLVVSDGNATSTPSTTTVSVANAAITVTSPNTSINWGVGSRQTIDWTHNAGPGSVVGIDVSRDGGATWNPIASSIANTGATAGSYAWVVTYPVTASARIRVRTASGAVSDVSNAISPSPHPS
jgi:PKD repeat protein